MDKINYKNIEDYINSLEENEKQLKFLLDLSDKIRPISAPREIQAIITDKSRRYFKADRCYYGEIHGDKVIIRKDSSRDNLGSLVGEYCWGRLLKYKPSMSSGLSVVEENLYSVENMDGSFKNELIEKGAISYILIPVVKENNPVGAFVISQSSPRKWTYAEVKLATNIAERTWMAVERARVENEKEKLLLQTIEEQSKLEAILENVDAAVWYTDRLGKTRLIGGRDKGDFSDKIHDLSSRVLSKNLLYSNMDGSQLLYEDIAALRALKGETVSKNGIIGFKDSNKQKYIELRSSPVRDKNSEIVGSVTLGIDIEERLKMEQTLKDKEKCAMELVRELEKTDELRIGFLSSLSHELRNPLATISMGLDLMAYIKANTEEEEKLKETLKRQTKQLTRLVDDLLNMTRISQNKFELTLERLELKQLLEEVVEDSNLFFKEKEIQVEKIIIKDEFFIEGDAARLRQVIENILHNASKFTPSGGKVTILLKEDKTKEDAIISIKDNGEGMSEELIKNIFEPYLQARSKTGQSIGGLGIGLSIAKDVVERHRGHIEVLSKGQGKGTEFIISLPLL